MAKNGDLFDRSGGSKRAAPTRTLPTRHADIEVLEGLEPVRKRPGMYIGGTDERAMHHLVAEVLDNAMDEAVAGHADRPSGVARAGNRVLVRDNGRGIPIDPHPKFPNKSALEVILTTLHSGGKFNGKVYATSGGLHGVGVSVVNALSDELTVEVARDRQLWTPELFAAASRVAKLKKAGPAPNRRGTTIIFHPDPEIFGKQSSSSRSGSTAWRARRPICSAASRSAGDAIKIAARRVTTRFPPRSCSISRAASRII